MGKISARGCGKAPGRVAHPLRSLQRVGIPKSEPLEILASDFPVECPGQLYSEPMPKGLKRYYGHDHLHFINCSCYHRQPWLAEPGRRDLFLETLEQIRQRHRFVVVGYVVMPDHIHLLISEPEQGTPSTVMQVLKQGFARRVLQERGPAFASSAKDEQLHVWQRRFYDFNVWSERKRVEKLRYMHRNPVKSGLVLEPEHWEWSSYRSYAFPEEGRVKINQWPAAVMKIRQAA
jgi:putative transposase